MHIDTWSAIHGGDFLPTFPRHKSKKKIGKFDFRDIILFLNLIDIRYLIFRRSHRNWSWNSCTSIHEAPYTREIFYVASPAPSEKKLSGKFDFWKIIFLLNLIDIQKSHRKWFSNSCTSAHEAPFTRELFYLASPAPSEKKKWVENSTFGKKSYFSWI